MHDDRIFSAGLRHDLPTLDLHSYKKAEAFDKLELFLFSLVKKKEFEARIVYGIGKGVLEQEVVAYLQSHPLIDKISREPGSCVVTLK